MTSQKHYTASELTKFAIGQLEFMGFVVWRANNIAVPGRKFIGMRGMSDIIGYHRVGGKSVWCEVKTINDRLSKFQTDFLDFAKLSGCHTFICSQAKDGNVELKNWG